MLEAKYMEREILNIPIYRCPSQIFERDMNEEKRKLLESCKAETGTESYTIISQSFDREKWHPWRYNEIIGWIQLVLNRSKLIGELWFVKNRISRKLKNKRFFYQGKAFECFLHNYQDNAEIANHVFNTLKEWYFEHSNLRKRYIDLKDVEFKLTMIDWILTIRLITSESTRIF